VMEKGEKGEFHGVMVSHGKRREAYKKRNWSHVACVLFP
jgi:hypothetical protein